jgi:hypothetical protein
MKVILHYRYELVSIEKFQNIVIIPIMTFQKRTYAFRKSKRIVDVQSKDRMNHCIDYH